MFSLCRCGQTPETEPQKEKPKSRGWCLYRSGGKFAEKVAAFDFDKSQTQALQGLIHKN